MPQTFPCPKCGRALPPAGELEFAGSVIPVLQCDECITRATFLGEEMELPLTFIVGPDGQPMDPASADGSVDRTPWAEDA